jgi:hypothetical protein
MATIDGGIVMNKSEVLKALEWVDLSAREGDVTQFRKAKQAFEEELASKKNTRSSEEAHRSAVESFVRKHGREPLEDAPLDD